MPKLPTARSLHWWGPYHDHRALGLRTPLGWGDVEATDKYRLILPCTSWDGDSLKTHRNHGGVYNLEFSPDG